MIRPWVFEFFHALSDADKRAGVSARDHFDRHLKMWERDEALGYEGIFFSEHHFGPGYSPAPNLLVAAMAGRTRRMRLGVMGVSTAYCNALRIVEEAAMLDNLTDGRLEIGMVRGVPPELVQLGMTLEDAEKKFDAELRAVDAALRTADGHFACGPLKIEPPMRQAAAPKWAAITSDGSARRAASLGWKACAGFVSVADLIPIFDAYRAAGGLSWNDALDRLGVRRRVHFTPAGADVKAVRSQLRQLAIAVLKGESGAPAPSQTAPMSQPMIDLELRLQKIFSDDDFIVGAPAQVADEIISQCRAVGCAHFTALLDSTPVFEETAERHRIFGEEVIPILRRANLTRS